MPENKFFIKFIHQTFLVIIIIPKFKLKIKMQMNFKNSPHIVKKANKRLVQPKDKDIANKLKFFVYKM